MVLEYKIFNPGDGDREIFKEFIISSDKWFTPSLSQITDVRTYAEKLFDRGTKFVCIKDRRIIGLTVAYINTCPLFSFGSYTVVDPEFDGLGIGLTVTANAIKYAKEYGSEGFKLKMRADNRMLLKFYQKMGFVITSESCFPNTDIKELELTKIF